MRRALDISAWVLLLGAIALLPAFSSRERAKMPCEGVRFHIPAGEEVVLISADDLNAFLHGGFDTLENKPLHSVRPDTVEKWLERNPYVLDAEAHVDLQNKLCISIRQEKPLFRIFTPEGKSVYLSMSGRILPLKRTLPVRVPVVNGFMGDLPSMGRHINPDDHPRLSELHKFGLFISNDEFFSLLFSQVYINLKGEFTLVPSIGTHSILLGKMNEDFHARMEKLRAFYEQGLVRGPWDRYEKINLTYKDQVVCTKR